MKRKQEKKKRGVDVEAKIGETEDDYYCMHLSFKSKITKALTLVGISMSKPFCKRNRRISPLKSHFAASVSKVSPVDW